MELKYYSIEFGRGRGIDLFSIDSIANLQTSLKTAK